MAQFSIIVAAILWFSWQVWVVPMWNSCEALTGDLEPRINDCSRLISVSKWHPDLVASTSYLYVRRGYHYLELRRFADAVTDAENALQYAYNNTVSRGDAVALRATANSNAGWFNRALKDLNTLAKLYPESAEVLVERGIVQRRLGNYDMALSDYAAALEHDPQNASAYNSRAWARYLKGDFEAALKDADRSVELSPADPGAIDTRAQIMLAMGRKDEALTDLLNIANSGHVNAIRRYQQILALRGYASGSEPGVSSDEFVTSLKQCVQDGCKLAFDVELEQSEPAD